MKMRVLIVDDEPLAREGIVFQLRNESDVEIVAECEDGSAAIEAIRRHKPDLVFLDIKMPKVSGFNVIEQIGSSNMPLVIFLTAYDEHAVEAFRLNALDYLLKPIDKARFQESLQKARKQLQKDRMSAQGEQLEQLLAAMRNSGKTTEPAVPPRIPVKLGSSIQFLHPDDLLWVEAEGDYVNVHTTARSHLVRETMLVMEKRLEPYGFQRIHRSAIVNLDKITKLVAAENGDYEVLMTNGLPLKIGRNYREALFSRMKISL
jgi:two-component system, LytTR family, response regulator